MAKPKRSLVDFVRAKKKRDCPICRLPAEIRQQLQDAREKKIRRSEQLEWLAVEYGIKLTAAQFDTHNSARHDLQ